MSRPTRRRMLRDSAIAAAMLTAGFPNRFDMGSRPAFAGEPAAAGKDRLNVMVCGVAGRGWALANAFAQHPSCRVTFICDVDEAIGRNRVDEFERRYGYRPAFTRDLRHGCDDKNLDVVVVATPNHWHALAAIWAMQAGKDVYLEKPVSHTIWEGQQLIAAARKHQRICQTGTQSRSLDGAIAAVDYVQSGKIGDVRLARGLCYKRRKSIGSKGIVEPPAAVDYDLWVGPAEMRPVDRPRFHYDWHWQYHWGNGDLNNQGVHQMDVARWGLGVDSLSDSVISYGGRLGYADAGDTPNTQVAIHRCGDKTITFEVRGLETGPMFDAKIGDIFYGTDGIVALGDWGRGVALAPDGKVVERFGHDVAGSAYEVGTISHVGNFVDAVTRRSPAELHADVREGHLSAGLGHAAAISYRLGKPASVDEVIEALAAFGGADDNLEVVTRTVDHLQVNGVDLEVTPLQLGLALQMDPHTETFTGNEMANNMLTRKYRHGFEVPDLRG